MAKSQGSNRPHATETQMTHNGQHDDHLQRDARVVMSCWPRMLTVEMAAKYLGLSAKTIRNHRYRLPGMRKWGGKVVFDRQAIDRMLDHSGGRRSLWIDSERLCK